MIQFKRGRRTSWLSLKKPLADGQPGYDKDRHKIKIGNGKDLWSALPYASGLSKEEIFDEESKAKARSKANAEDKTIITYGTTSPDDGTVGQLYLQYYDTDPEVDYVVDWGINGNWTFQKWKSGIAKCWGTFDFETTVQSAIDNSNLYQSSSSMKVVNYPFTFIEVPSETATIHSDGSFVWLASNKGLATKSTSASYCVVSPDKLTNSSKYKVTLVVEGFWK
jgi:hypothetical protein